MGAIWSSDASRVIAASSQEFDFQIRGAFIQHSLFGTRNSYVAHGAELLVPAVEALRRAKRAYFAEYAFERSVEEPGCFVQAGVGAADGLGHDLVDDAEPQQVRRRELERLGRFDLAIGIPPEDRGAAFGGNHAVDRELVHENPVADRDAERAAAASLAMHDHDDRHIERSHLPQVERDRFRNAALLRLDAGIGRG